MQYEIYFPPPLGLDYLKANTTFNMHLPSSQLHCHTAPPTRARKRLYTIFHFSSLSVSLLPSGTVSPGIVPAGWQQVRHIPPLLRADDYKSPGVIIHSDKIQYKNSCPLMEKWNINSRKLLWFNLLNYTWMIHFPMCLWHSSKITQKQSQNIFHSSLTTYLRTNIRGFSMREVACWEQKLKCQEAY